MNQKVLIWFVLFSRFVQGSQDDSSIQDDFSIQDIVDIECFSPRTVERLKSKLSVPFGLNQPAMLNHYLIINNPRLFLFLERKAIHQFVLNTCSIESERETLIAEFRFTENLQKEKWDRRKMEYNCKKNLPPVMQFLPAQPVISAERVSTSSKERTLNAEGASIPLKERTRCFSCLIS